MREIQTTVNSARSSSKKRPSSVASAPSLQFSKKRVPLGDLTNSPSLITPSTRNSDHQTTCNSECIFKVVTQNSNVETSARPKARLKKRNKKDPENSLTSESTQNSDVEVNQKTECKLKISTKSNPENSPSKGSTKDLGLRKCSYSSSIYEYLHSLEVQVNKFLLLLVIWFWMVFIVWFVRNWKKQREVFSIIFFSDLLTYQRNWDILFSFQNGSFSGLCLLLNMSILSAF